MKYFKITFPGFSALIIKSNKPNREIFRLLTNSQGIENMSGIFYNLRNFESFYELNYPDAATKSRALTADRIVR